MIPMVKGGGQALGLVADIGGTNARFALVAGHQLITQTTLATRDYDNLIDAITYFLSLHQPGQLIGICLAIAGPVDDDIIEMTNNHWVIDKAATQNALQQPIIWINDFAAQAMGISVLQTEDTLLIKSGTAKSHGNRLVIGPGTGLGVSGLVWHQTQWIPVIGEGGHCSLAPTNKQERELQALMSQEGTRVSSEHWVSGTGLLKLYQAMAKLTKQTASCQTSKAITEAAYQHDDVLALATMAVFFRQLGQVVLNAAFTLGATGGVYLTGGLLPKLQNALINSEFNHMLAISGKHQAYIDSMPVWLNLDEDLGLKGAAVTLINQANTHQANSQP